MRRMKSNNHPRVSFQLSRQGTDNFVNVQGVADSGAQSNLWGLKEFEQAGFKQSDLKPVTIKVRAANKNPINIIGAFDVTF